MNKVADMSVWNACSEFVDELSAAMAKAFGQLQNVTRNKVSHFAKKGKDGKPVPDYADLASCFDCIRAAYAANGLSVRQTFHPYGDDGTIYLVTTIRHSSGQFERSYLPMAGRIPPQELAKTATYLKRIALCAAVGIAADDDDDGEQAQKSAITAAAEDSTRFERALVSKVRSCKSPEAVSEVVTQAERGLEQGKITADSLRAVKLVAAEVAVKLGLQPQPALAS